MVLSQAYQFHRARVNARQGAARLGGCNCRYINHARDTSVTARLIHHFLAKTQFTHEKDTVHS